MMDSSDDEFMTKLNNVMNLPDVKEKVQTYSASKLQENDYRYTQENLLKAWGTLAAFGAVYALIGLLFLEGVDRDKR